MTRPSNTNQFPAFNALDNGRSGDAPEEDWQRYVPAEWRDAVAPPLYFERHVEYEIKAGRILGYDAEHRICFTSHHFQLAYPASDDDEDFYEVVAYTEEMAAWRLRDERWLVFRLIGTGDCQSPRGFYVLSPEMPR